MTICGLLEPEVCIGDIFQLGSAIEMPLKVQEIRLTGFYFRVLQRGKVFFDDKLILLRQHPQAITVAFANRVMHHDKNLLDATEKLLSVKELSESWRSTLEK